MFFWHFSPNQTLKNDVTLSAKRKNNKRVLINGKGAWLRDGVKEMEHALKIEHQVTKMINGCDSI